MPTNKTQGETKRQSEKAPPKKSASGPGNTGSKSAGDSSRSPASNPGKNKH